MDAVLAFELANRTYFAQFIDDRGDDFYERYAERHRELLMEQDSGVCIFHVLVDQHGAIAGRFNLYDVLDGSARVGYRVAQRAAGRGVATSALRELCRLAPADYGLRTLTAETSSENRASQRVLEKAGFSATEDCDLAGQPGIRYTLRLTVPA
jgi:[ribosomal protein S5]-alanine N-acetyltransferase